MMDYDHVMSWDSQTLEHVRAWQRRLRRALGLQTVAAALRARRWRDRKRGRPARAYTVWDRATQCPRGHARNLTTGRWRECRTCLNARQREYQRRRRMSL